MLFNSLDFAFFLPVVFALYWLLKGSVKAQNLLVVIASYLFYGWWDWRFLFLIAFSTAVDFYAGKVIGGSGDEKKRKYFLWFSLGVNLGLLGFFKYYNFFIENFIEAFSFFGMKADIHTLNIILPVGISFYTFQTLSYTIDVYRGNLAPARHIIPFAAYVSFFPQLVAGPIERATHLLPQFYGKREFNYALARSGMLYILWGLFKKMVIADNCAIFVNEVYGHSAGYTGPSFLFVSILFAFQIYGDFSGYSDIAIGCARLFGFDLMRNFAFPYFSRDIAEFWRRWHISLSTWFRDYLYIPLGGSRGGLAIKLRNTFIIFLVSGFWHGANWTFIIWGALNAIYFLPLLLTNRNRAHLDIVAPQGYFPSAKDLLNIGITFSLTVLAWIFFRAESVSMAWSVVTRIFTDNPATISMNFLKDAFYLVVLIAVFILTEWAGRKHPCPLLPLSGIKFRWIRWFIYGLVVFLILIFTPTTQSPFIYFQF